MSARAEFEAIELCCVVDGEGGGDVARGSAERAEGAEVEADGEAACGEWGVSWALLVVGWWLLVGGRGPHNLCSEGWPRPDAPAKRDKKVFF
jgi:hypothetical protein